MLALVTPQLSFALRSLLNTGSWAETIEAYDPIERLGGESLLSRLDLGAASVQKRLAIVGPALALVGYGTSWLAFKLFGGLSGGPQRRLERAAQGASRDGGSAGSADSESDLTSLLNSSVETGPFGDRLSGAVSTDTPAWLLVSSPHSGTTFEILGSLGVAITVLVAATAMMARLPRMRRLATPVVAVGTMSLTVYVGHIMAFWSFPTGTIQILAAYVAGAVLFAAAWSRFFRRGPLEYLLNSSTMLARLIR